MPVPQVAVDHQRRQNAVAAGAVAAVAQLWADVDPDDIGGSWAAMVPRAATVVAAAQLAAALGASEYLDELLGAAAPAVAAVAPQALSGVASDGRSLDTLLAQPAVTALTRIKRGTPPGRALAAGRWQLDNLARTQALDAGRAAEQVGMAARPRVVAYTRVVTRPACARCVVLAGREYAWSTGFKRHPQCDCRMLPLRPGEARDRVGTDPRDMFDAMSRAEQDRRFGRHAAEAIREGADISQVVNARRGMQAASDRTRGRYTTEGTTVRGYAGRRLGDLTDTSGRFRRSSRPRLMPEAIMRDARDREHALELLYQHGYLENRAFFTDPPAPATGSNPSTRNGRNQ